MSGLQNADDQLDAVGGQAIGTPTRARQIIRAVVIVDLLLLPANLVSLLLTSQYQATYGSNLRNFLLAFGTLVQVAVAAIVGLRRPGNPVGWLLLLSVTANLVDSGAFQPFVIYSIDISNRAVPGGDMIGTFDQMMWIPYVVPIAILLPLVFPSGTLLSRRWRIIVWVATAASVIAFIGGTFAPNPSHSNVAAGVRQVGVPEPFSTIAGIMQASIALLPLCVLAGVVALSLRYKRGSADERHQVKWLIAAVTIYLVGFAASLIPTFLGHPIPVLQDIAVVGLSLIPVAAAVAVLKYRLYDIDIVISRALVYGSLALFITAVYVGIVVGVGTLVGSGGKPNLLLSIVATAVVAVAFQPVRERVQKVANRLVYGTRATPYEVLSEFSQRVAESYAGEQVLGRMAQVLAEGTGAETGAVWLRSGVSLRRAAAWPAAGNGHRLLPVELTGQLLPDLPGAGHAVAVRHQGELLGALTVTKRAGETLTPIEEKLLDDLAHQAGLVLKNVGLTADLQARLDDLRASRQRLVAAQDQERRRLERNLHDGAQQNLVALKVKLGLAERLLAGDPKRAKAAITELKADADVALETLRDLARGIYPPLLADRGLAAALESQARKATLPVRVEANGLRRYPQEIEGAIYFCCLEALQNVQKYAGAASASILLRHDDGGLLTFEVRDDGSGFDPSRTPRGSGLQNIEDRLNALGGSMVIESTPAKGTALIGTLPGVEVAAVEERVAATT
ncbi:MAG TPA: histidine kinase [Candidatus Dormibacteraeota bacterium]|nr:histidine kinase [Candidatus Dormibacteraeota bacterium]